MGFGGRKDFRKLGNALRRRIETLGAGRQAKRRAALRLPLAAESADELAVRLGPLLRHPRTRTYVDTSFLMWMTKIGSGSLDELIDWLSKSCQDRLSVPVWAAHEYYRHHTKGTITQELSKQFDQLDKIAKSTYTTLWPILDSSDRPGAKPTSQHADVRESLRGVLSLRAVEKKWISTYQDRAAAVIRFLNEFALKGSEVPSYFGSIEAIADARFTGRVPPGFQDRGKSEAQDDDGVVGDNRWGDLLFWQEVLDDAHKQDAGVIVVLTRDLKNDWRAAGSLPIVAGSDDRAAGVAVVPAHPFLAFEAALRAGSDEVLLVDPRKLADAAAADAPELTRSFVSVARVPSLPGPKSRDEVRAEAVDRETLRREAVPPIHPAPAGASFPDPDGMTSSAPILARCLYESRSLDATDAVTELEGALMNGETLQDALSGERVGRLGPTGLVLFARRLGARANGSAEAAAEQSDLLALLDRLPPVTASMVYLGTIAAMYLDSANAPIIAPTSPSARKLFALQASPLAREPIQALRTRLNKSKRLPAYVPDPTMPMMRIPMHSDAEMAQPNVLRSILVHGQNVVVPTQGDRELRFVDLLGEDRATPDRLLDLIADLYAIPRDQTTAEADVDVAFDLEPTAGLRSSKDVWQPMSEDQ